MTPEEWRPDDRVGTYRLVEKLAAGGMGEVWRAWDERLKRTVALKHVLPRLLEMPGARERFRREAEALARLSHRAVVQIFDLVESPQGDCIVMELATGSTLRRLLAEGPLAVEDVLRWGAEIASGLAAAHAQGILHRDLKAANVMIAPGGSAKILDFGIARRPPATIAEETTISQPGTLLGTSYAMSPEQVLGLPLDPRSDLFAFGSLLYEMLTGEAPFRAETAAASFARVCSYRPCPVRELRPEVPGDLSALVERLLEKEPNARPQGAAEVADHLAAMAHPSGARPFASSDGTRPGQGGPESRPSGEVVWTAAAPDYRSEGSSAGYPALLRSPWRRFAGLALAALVVALGLGWLFGRLPVSRRASTYQLYQEGLEALHRYDKKGNLDAAIADFRQIVARDPSHAPAHAALARAYVFKSTNQSRDRIWLDQALPLAERAVALDGFLASARVSLGSVYTALGRPDEAARELDRALQLEPGNADAEFGRGALYEARTQLVAAETAYRKAISLRPERQYYDALGSLYLRTGRLAQAVTAFESSIRLAPDGLVGYRNLGTAYYLQGDLARAATQLQKALEIQPEPSLYSNLGTLYFAQGLYPQAAQAFERALELPGGANDPLLWGNLGDACRFLPESRERSREAYTRALQLLADSRGAAKEDATLLSRRTLYLAKRGDCASALAASAASERLATADPSSEFRLVVAAEVCGRREPALAALARALRAGLPLTEVQRDPELLQLRGDVRYHRLLAQLAPAPTGS